MNRLATTGNITWDGRLEDFKGSDTTQYVRTAVDLARTCGACPSELTPGGPVSLVVEIMQSTAPDGSEFLTFTDFVCHRWCSDPAVVVRQTPWEPHEMSPIAVRAVFTQKSSAGRTRAVPVLAYTLDQVLSFRENGSEMISALVSLLLSRGFQLAMSADYSAILQQAQPTATNCTCTLTPAGLLRFSSAGEVLYREQLNPQDADDAEWITAATAAGRILIISGDYLNITDTSLDLRTAARRGTLVIGTVPFNDSAQKSA
ncbi:hypothetical protein [Arthrobacter sp. AFG20]|uniref:hypothetical protein n=1 Tax=Arthrobacter sp. AFG20 TaxID=1688671 RepID=UPI0011AEC991|nr:hypothetical protein [Arthrobacter sp. AFG20]